MKKIPLLIVMVISLCMLFATEITIGDATTANTTTGSPTPYGTWYRNFRQQYLYTSDEIFAAGGALGTITQIGFNVQAVNNCSPMPNFTINIKHTQQDELTTTFEVGDYTEVWYQNDFLPVEGWNIHTLDTPFFWDGSSNLLVEIVTTLIPGNYTQNASVYYTATTGVNTCLRYQSDSSDAGSSTTGTLSVNRANTRFNLNITGMGSISGTVNDPVGDVGMVINGTTHATQTAADGTYSFPYVEPGDHTVTASKLGFESQTLPVTVVVGQNSVLDFDLVPSPSVNVTGHVVGSDQPTVGLADAVVVLTGIMDYDTTTDANGDFAIPGVLSVNTYDYMISLEGYQPATGSIDVASTDYDMGTVTLNGIALPPFGVQAELVGPSTVNITWMPPGTGGDEWIHYDSGENYVSIGTGGAADFDVAIRFPASEMQDYAGMSLYAVKAWPAQAGNFAIRVWTGGNASAPGQMVVDQPFTPDPLDSYNTVILDDPVTITGTEELWFGYRCNVTSGYPAGCDAGPADDGFGNMIYYQGAWSTLIELSPALNYNWNIQGYVGYSAPDAAPLLTQGITPAMPEGERPCVGSLSTSGNPRKGHTRSAQPEVEAKQVDSAGMISWQSDRSLEGYKVWRLMQGQESNETAWILLTPNPITATNYQDTGMGDVPSGAYKWAVKAIYTGGAQSVPAFSNALYFGVPSGTIAGIVRSTQNVPIMGATVTCGDTTATTNYSGAYSMQVIPGTHSVTASHPNYSSVTQTGVVVCFGGTTMVNFQLSLQPYYWLEDGFESYDNFAIEFAPWTLVDLDLSGTYGMTGVTWPNAYEPMAYMIFVPSATTPPVDDAEPHGGIKQAASFAATTPPNNDWLITPLMSNPGQISFWAKTYTDQYGLERFKVGVSTTGTNPADFTIISGTNYIEAPTDWTEYTYDISSYYGNVYIGIQCVSDDAFIFFVDDVSIGYTGGNEDPGVPVVATELHGNYPNPFNPQTTIRYSVKEAMPVTIEIYNLKGQRVRTLVNEAREAGNYSVVWNGRDNNNQTVSSGVYYFKMNAGKYSNTKKMILMK